MTYTFTLIGGQADGLAYSDPEARTPSASGNHSTSFFLLLGPVVKIPKCVAWTHKNIRIPIQNIFGDPH
jgi:hypothetical protein